MRIIIILLLALSWKISNVKNESCGKPEVGRELWHIYRVNERINTTVLHCFYQHDLHSYSDITENCIRAFYTDVYTDKWNDHYFIEESPSIRINSYNAIADVIQNKIVLKSGTTCRYDRGFCYDLKVSSNYAAVWEVVDKNVDLKEDNLDQIFYGWVDTWTLRKNGLKYLVFQDTKTDRSFALQLEKKDNIRGKDFWYTKEYGIVASQNSLKINIESTPRLNQKYFDLKPKQYVSEQILRNCDLESFPLDFERNINENYLSDLKNLKAILALLQEQLIKIKTDHVVTGNKENLASSKDISQLKSDIRDVQALLFVKNKEVSELQANLTSTENTLSETGQGVIRTEEEIKQILNQQGSQNTELRELRNRFTVLQNEIFSLENGNNRQMKEITDLKNVLSELRMKLLPNDENIFDTLNDTYKEVKAIANNLSSIYSQLQYKDELFRKEKDFLIRRLDNLELALSTQNKHIAKCQNDIKTILTEQEKCLSENNKEIKALHVSIEQLKENDECLLGKINKCQEETNEKLREKDEMIRRIVNEFLKREDAIRMEIKEKDIKCDKLMEEIREIKENIFIVEPR